MTKKQYNQSGGWLPYVMKAILEIVVQIVIFMWGIVKLVFKICPNPDAANWKECGNQWPNPKNWDWGSFWVYIWWCGKITIYCAIFMFGGPVIILGGLIYLYSKLFSKMKERTDGIKIGGIELVKPDNNSK